MPAPMLSRLSGAYGTRLGYVLAGAHSLAGLGRHFGADLYEAEVRYLVEREFARGAADVLWRRTKLGLVLGAAEEQALENFIGAMLPARAARGRDAG